MKTGTQIRDADIIKDSYPEGFRDISYDVRIGTIIAPDGNCVEHYNLGSQGVVQVVSKETVFVPTNLVGVAHVKTSLSGEGIQALNVGLVDPGWDAPLSSFLINFGRKGYELRTGDAFLRITFTQLEAAVIPRIVPPTRDDYISKRIGIAKEIGGRYLNLDSLASEVVKKTAAQYSKWALAVVALGGFILAVFSCLTGVAIVLASNALQFTEADRLALVRSEIDKTYDRSKSQYDDMRHETDVLKNSLKQQEDENAQLRKQLDDFAKELLDLHNATSNPPSIGRPAGHH